MNPCLKQLFRSPIRMAAFLLLLALSGAMLCVGLNIFLVAKEQAARMDAAYTTVAVPDYRTQFMLDDANSAVDAPKPDPLAYFQEQKARNELIALAKTAAEISAYVRLADRRLVTAAYIPDSVPVTSGSTDPKKYYHEFDAPYDLAIFVVNCATVRHTEQLGMTTYASANGVETSTIEYARITYEVSAAVEECVLLNAAYAPPGTLIISGDILDATGSIPFEAGKRYLVWGVYTAPGIIQIGLDEWQVNPDAKPSLALGHSLIYGNEFGEENLQLINGKYYAEKRMIEDYPVCTELPMEMDAATFLNSATGAAWENAYALCDITQQSVPVIATQKLESMLAFNTLQASIIAGRSFTPEEYASNAKACVIGSEYAQKNGLHAGSTLVLSFYEASIHPDYLNIADSATLLTVEPYLPGTQMSVQEAYTVVGIYQSTGFHTGNYSFSPNTVFIPGGATALGDFAPGQNLSVFGMPILYSLVLENGSIERFEQEMAEQGFAGCFLYYDQGYAQAEGSIDALTKNAVRLSSFSTALSAVSALLYALFYAIWAKRAAISMRLLGAKRTSAFYGTAAGALLTAFIAIPIGMAAGYLLFGRAAALVFGTGSAARFSLESAMLAATAQFMFAGLASLCFLAEILIKNPLRLMGKVQ